MFAMETDKARLLQSKYEGSAAKQVFAVLLASTAAFSFGYTIGFSSPAIPSMITGKIISVENSGFFGSLMTVGAILGGPFGGWCVEKFGRKRTILFTSLPYLCGWLTIAFHQKLLHLYIGRLLTGFGSGMTTVCVPVYIAEVSSKSYRGLLGTCTQLFITMGILAVYLFGSVMEWKSLALIAIIPALSTAVSSFILPESPHWLLGRGKKAEALEALKGVRDPHMDVGEECRDIEDSINAKESIPYSEFLKPELFKPLLIIVLIMVFQQFTGINAVMFYTVTIFEKSIPSFAHKATVGIGVVQVLGTLAASFLMDRAGRRRLLTFSGIVMSLSLFLLGYYFGHEDVWSAGFLKTWLPVASLMLFVIGFSLGWGPIPMLAMSELLPARVRGAASAIAIFTNWTCAFIVTMEFIHLQALLGSNIVFYMFGASCFISVCFVLRYLPETKGKSLEDIELFFLGKGVRSTSAGIV